MEYERSITSTLSTEGQCYHHMLSICVLSVGERPDRIRLALREPKGFESPPWPSKCVHHNTRFLTGLKTWLLIGPLTLIFFVPMIPPRLFSNFNMHILLCSMGQVYQKTFPLSQFSVLHFHDKTHFYCQSWKTSCFIFAQVLMAILYCLIWYSKKLFNISVFLKKLEIINGNVNVKTF